MVSEGIFVDSDVLIKAIIDGDERVVERLELLAKELNVKAGEKLEITDYAYNDVITVALDRKLDLRSVFLSLYPGHTTRYHISYIPEWVKKQAFNAMYVNPEVRLSLTEWATMIWMHYNAVRFIVSDNPEIDRVVEAARKPNAHPIIFDDFRNIKRI